MKTLVGEVEESGITAQTSLRTIFCHEKIIANQTKNTVILILI